MSIYRHIYCKIVEIEIEQLVSGTSYWGMKNWQWVQKIMLPAVAPKHLAKAILYGELALLPHGLVCIPRECVLPNAKHMVHSCARIFWPLQNFFILLQFDLYLLSFHNESLNQSYYARMLEVSSL